jgi:VanZ family protein
MDVERTHPNRPSWPWLAALVLMACFVWGNSLVPGDESGSLSLRVVAEVRALLDACGLPSGWVTNFVVRKAAHFSEYLVLGLVAMRAFRPHRIGAVWAAVAVALTVVAVPSVDETIQLFVDGRSGQVTDVLIDCAGACTGVLLTWLASRVRRRRA